MALYEQGRSQQQGSDREVSKKTVAKRRKRARQDLRKELYQVREVTHRSRRHSTNHHRQAR